MKFSKVRDVKSPSRGTAFSAGIDFYVPNDFERIALHPMEDILIPSGIKVAIPSGFMLLGVDKSGIASSECAKLRSGVKKYDAEAEDKPSLLIGAKLIDEDYQGEIHIHIINTGNIPYIIEPGTKIAQFVLVPVSYENVEEVSEKDLYENISKRGSGGFGHAGIK